MQSDLPDLTWFRRGVGANALEAPEAPALHGFDVGEDAQPVLVDWDQDGDLDLIVGSADGRLWYFPQADGKFLSANQHDGPFAGVDAPASAMLLSEQCELPTRSGLRIALQAAIPKGLWDWETCPVVSFF